MADIVCKDCNAKKLMIWFTSQDGKRDLCDKCYLLDGKKKK